MLLSVDRGQVRAALKPLASHPSRHRSLEPSFLRPQAVDVDLRPFLIERHRIEHYFVVTVRRLAYRVGTLELEMQFRPFGIRNKGRRPVPLSHVPAEDAVRTDQLYLDFKAFGGLLTEGGGDPTTPPPPQTNPVLDSI